MDQRETNEWVDRLAGWHAQMSRIAWELATLCPHVEDHLEASRTAKLAKDILATADRLIPVTQLLRKSPYYRKDHTP